MHFDGEELLVIQAHGPVYKLSGKDSSLVPTAYCKNLMADTNLKCCTVLLNAPVHEVAHFLSVAIYTPERERLSALLLHPAITICSTEDARDCHIFLITLAGFAFST